MGEVPRHVEMEMNEGKEGTYGQTVEAVKEIAKAEPLLRCAGDTIYAEYCFEVGAKNSKETVDAAIDRAMEALKVEKFEMKHMYGGFDDKSAGDQWKVVREGNA